MDFLASIAPPVMSQPQAFSDAMLDPASRGIMTGLTTAHMSGTTLQSVVRQSADQLQRTVQGQFVSLKVRNTLTTALVVFHKECLQWAIHAYLSSRIVMHL